MTDSAASVGNLDSEVEEEETSPAGQQSPDNLSTVLSELQSLKDRFSTFERGMQKGNDKINARVEKRIEEALGNPQIARILELARAKKSPEEIENQLILDSLIAERKDSGARTSSEARGSGGAESQALFSALADTFGLDANDAAVAKAFSENDFTALAALAKAKLNAPSPDSSAGPPLTSKESAAGENPDEKSLRKAYEKEIAALKQNRTFNARTFANLKIKYRGKGLQIY